MYLQLCLSFCVDVLRLRRSSIDRRLRFVELYAFLRSVIMIAASRRQHHPRLSIPLSHTPCTRHKLSSLSSSSSLSIHMPVSMFSARRPDSYRSRSTVAFGRALRFPPLRSKAVWFFFLCFSSGSESKINAGGRKENNKHRKKKTASHPMAAHVPHRISSLNLQPQTCCSLSTLHTDCLTVKRDSLRKHVQPQIY